MDAEYQLNYLKTKVWEMFPGMLSDELIQIRNYILNGFNDAKFLKEFNESAQSHPATLPTIGMDQHGNVRVGWLEDAKGV